MTTTIAIQRSVMAISASFDNWCDLGLHPGTLDSDQIDGWQLDTRLLPNITRDLTHARASASSGQTETQSDTPWPESAHRNLDPAGNAVFGLRSVRARETDPKRPKPRSLLTALFICLCSTAIMTGATHAANLAGTTWEKVALPRSIDPLILYAIALAESGRRDSEGTLRPWPWTLNIEGRPVFADTRAQALSLLEDHQGSSVDVGLLQVNTKWHGHRVESVSALLDPKINLAVGATILEEAMATAPADLTTGIGRYHSARPDRARGYARIVLSFYRHLLHQRDVGEIAP